MSGTPQLNKTLPSVLAVAVRFCTALKNGATVVVVVVAAGTVVVVVVVVDDGTVVVVVVVVVVVDDGIVVVVVVVVVVVEAFGFSTTASAIDFGPYKHDPLPTPTHGPDIAYTLKRTGPYPVVTGLDPSNIQCPNE